MLSKTTAANPQLFEANLNLGLIKMEMGKYNAAIELLEEAENIRPSMPQTAYALGVSHRGLAITFRQQNSFTQQSPTSKASRKRFGN